VLDYGKSTVYVIPDHTFAISASSLPNTTTGTTTTSYGYRIFFKSAMYLLSSTKQKPLLFQVQYLSWQNVYIKGNITLSKKTFVTVVKHVKVKIHSTKSKKTSTETLVKQ
jgi:hypothetical protein